MYSVFDYGRMAADAVRMDAYERAIAAVVRPGSVVVDVGAGTGVFSLLAARAGARRVHAIEPNPAVFLLPELAAASGLGDRIVIHARPSSEVELPAPADVLVSDLRGSLPLHEGHVDAIRDARSRLLAPGGVQIPAGDRLFAAPVEAPELWRSLARGWQSLERLGFDAAAARRSVLNAIHPDGASPIGAQQLLGEGACWAEIDYTRYDGAPLTSSVETTASRTGTLHGIALWFEAHVHGDIRYTTAPGSQLTYGRSFLPLLEPLDVRRGDRIAVTLRTDARGTRWAWDTEVARTGHAPWSARQATFLGAPTSPELLLRSSSTATPRCGAEGTRLLEVLRAMDGRTTVAEIARRLAASHPSRLGEPAALADVQRIAATYGEAADSASATAR